MILLWLWYTFYYMTEKPPSGTEGSDRLPQFEEESQVRLKENLSEDVYKALSPQVVRDEVYQINRINRSQDEGGDAIFVRSTDDVGVWPGRDVPVSADHFELVFS